MPRRLILICLFFLAAFSAAAQDYHPSFDTADCPESIAERIASRVDFNCGWLRLPEDRANPAGSWLDLFIIRLGARDFVESPPLLVLAGGPGDAASADIDFWLESGLHTERDIILVDQRGTGRSRPSLHCPEASETEDKVWIAACRERLTRQGIDVSNYHAVSTVRDLQDLLLTLDLEHVHLYGSSYGSRLALLLANSAPESIRSMTLDGAYPPSRLDLAELPMNVERSLERLFLDCAGDTACHRLFPDLRQQFYRAFMELNESPAELYHLGESTGGTMDGDTFALMISAFLRHSIALPFLPALIASIEQGQHGLIFWVYGFVMAPYWGEDVDAHSEGAYFSVRCPDDQLLPASELLPHQQSETVSVIADALRLVGEEQVANCAAWNVPPASAPATLDFISDVPALFLSGAYDSATPPHWAESVAERLNSGWHFVFPNVSHGVLEDEPCAAAIMREFLDNPRGAPKAPCFDALDPPEFITDESAAE